MQLTPLWAVHLLVSDHGGMVRDNRDDVVFDRYPALFVPAIQEKPYIRLTTWVLWSVRF
jgi:hypothetical protein